MKKFVKMSRGRFAAFVLAITLVPALIHAAGPDEMIDSFYNREEAISADDLKMFMTLMEGVFGQSAPSLEQAEKILAIAERHIDATGSLPGGIEETHAMFSGYLCHLFTAGEAVEKNPEKAMEYVRRGLKYLQIVSGQDTQVGERLFERIFRAYSDLQKSENNLVYLPNTLIVTYADNELQADMTLKDKDIYIAVFPGDATRVEKDGDSYIVKYSPGPEVRAKVPGFSISCKLNPDALTYFADFSTPMILKGVCRGVTGFRSILIDNCSAPEELYGKEGGN